MSALVAESREHLEAQLTALEAELRRRQFLREPVEWVEKRLKDTLWSGQKRIIESVRDNRRTLVKSCHAIGKSFTSSTVAGWWLDNHPVGKAFVVTSAPTDPQVRAILWREINRVHSRGNLRGRTNQTEWFMTLPSGKEELVAFGRKPADYDPAAFQGIHAVFVLVILDEGCGIPQELYEAADSLIANDFSKILVIGNPDDPLAHFANISKPGSGWNVIEIGAFDSPNFTGEPIPDTIKSQLIGPLYVEEKRLQWAPNWRWNEDGTRVECPPEDDPQATHPYWQSKVLGKFPKVASEHALIPSDWIQAAMDRTLAPVGPNELGVDVGGGADSSTIAHRLGPRVRIVNEDHNPDTMHTCGLMLRFLARTGATVAKIDEIGIGRGVLDRAKELKKPVVGINVGRAAEEQAEETSSNDEEGFINLRAQLWWVVRSRFESGTVDIDPADTQLQKELTEIRYKRLSNGKIQIESKDDAKRRGVASPNRADALMLSFAPVPEEPDTRGTWGR